MWTRSLRPISGSGISVDKVPDMRAPDFAAEAHRQSELAAASAYEADDQAFVDAISSVDDDEHGE
jgi:hypothetical protein